MAGIEHRVVVQVGINDHARESRLARIANAVIIRIAPDCTFDGRSAVEHAPGFQQLALQSTSSNSSVL